MEIQVRQFESPTMVDRVIKIERDDDDDNDERASSENSETGMPCVSTVPIPADKNTGSYYYPSQAVVVPRTPMYTAVNKIAQKRKTVEALAQIGLMSADEPILFEETIWCDNAKIILIDTKTKQAIPREHLRKENITTITTSQPSHSNLSITTDSGRKDISAMTPDQSTRVSDSHLQHRKNGSTSTLSQMKAVSFSTSNTVAPLYSTPNTSSISTTIFRPNSPSSPSISSADATTQLSNRAARSQPAVLEILSTASTTKPRTSLLNSLPSERSLGDPLHKNFPEKSIAKHTTYKPLAVAPSASIRPESNSKTAVCLPNKTSITESSVLRGVYIPREINVGKVELKIEDCINVKDICDKELTKWTADDVAKFVRATDCAEYAHVFVDQEIDGKALTLLNQDLLIQWMKLKLGPAMKLNCHILNLKHSLNNS